MKQIIKIFYCYAHEDKALRDELEKHLMPLKRTGQITQWYDRDIQAGTEWAKEIETQLNAASIILLLVSPDFLFSDYCYGVEMQRALERHRAGDAHVIPIILRPALWEITPLSALQALPKDGEPITLWPNQDKAFYNVVQGIHTVVKTLLNTFQNEEREVNAFSSQQKLMELAQEEQLSQAQGTSANGGKQDVLRAELASVQDLEEVLIKAYKEVQMGRVTDPPTIYAIADKFDAITKDPELNLTVSFDAGRAAMNLRGRARILKELQT